MKKRTLKEAHPVLFWLSLLPMLLIIILIASCFIFQDVMMKVLNKPTVWHLVIGFALLIGNAMGVVARNMKFPPARSSMRDTTH